MDAERQKILEMVAAGEVSAEQAARLLDTIDLRPAAAVHTPARRTPLTASDLAELAEAGTTPELLEAVAETGIDADARGIARMAEAGVSPELVRAVAQAGLALTGAEIAE